MRGMWLMLQQDKPDDYVLATGETHSVRELCGSGFPACRTETGKTTSSRILATTAPQRVDLLIGDAAKARTALGWQPKVAFQELVEMMTDADLGNSGTCVDNGNDSLQHDHTGQLLGAYIYEWTLFLEPMDGVAG